MEICWFFCKHVVAASTRISSRVAVEKNQFLWKMTLNRSERVEINHKSQRNRTLKRISHSENSLTFDVTCINSLISHSTWDSIEKSLSIIIDNDFFLLLYLFILTQKKGKKNWRKAHTHEEDDDVRKSEDK